MKRLKSIFAVTLISLIVATAIFSINIFAGNETAQISLYHFDNALSSVKLEIGESYTLPTIEAKHEGDVYGWIDRDGIIYNAGDTIEINKDTTLFALEGTRTSSSVGFADALSKGYSYIELNSNVNVTGPVALPDGITYIDLNGYKLNVTSTSNAFTGTDIGLVIVDGTVNYTYSADDANLIKYSFFNVSPNADKCLVSSLVIGEGARLTTNMGLVEVSTDISSISSAVSVKIAGEVSCDRLMRTNGILDASLEIYESAKVTTTAEYLFDNYTVSHNGTYVKLTIYGGEFHIDNTTSYAKDSSSYMVAIKKGASAYFSKDITGFFPDKNYSFTLDDTTKMYKFVSCAHDGPVIAITINPDYTANQICTEQTSVITRCKYCETEENKSVVIGHNFAPPESVDIINTEEKTSEGYFKYTCTRCGEEEKKYFYPDPQSVYVSVIYLNENNERTEIRVPSLDLYTFEGTILMSFSTAYFESFTGVRQKNIVSVEVPLGTTEIYGNFHNGAGVGVFTKNTFLDEIILPRSLVNINQYAFAEMTDITTIYGLEYITGTISNNAFAQADGSLLRFNHLKLNASYIGEYAFKNARMKVLELGEGTSKIHKGAFKLEDQSKCELVEIFIAGNTKNGDTVSKSTPSGKSYNNSEQQYASLPIVYTGHSYSIVDVVDPSCSEPGYTRHTCDHEYNGRKCGLYYDDTPVVTLPHNYDYGVVALPATCVEYGYHADVCRGCGYENNIVWDINKDLTNHTFTEESVEQIFCYARDEDGEYIYDIDGNKQIGYICEYDYYTLALCIYCQAPENDIPANRVNYSALGDEFSHEWDGDNDIIIKEATCAEDGRKLQVCTLCSKEQESRILATGDHDYGDYTLKVETPATCKKAGTGYLVCKVCGFERARSIPSDPNAHVKLDGDKGTVALEPTAQTKGSRLFYCSLCASPMYEEIDKLPLEEDNSLSPVIIVLIVIGGVLLVGGVGITIYLTFSKKKNKARGFKYHFNTLKK